MDISKKLKERRKELELTMLEVAQRTGVSEATVSRWESGDIANMRRDKIVLLANALRVSPSFIMGWEEPEDKAKPEDKPKKDISQMTAREILDYAESMNETTYDLLGYDGKNRTRTTLTKDEYEKVKGIIEILRKETH